MHRQDGGDVSTPTKLPAYTSLIEKLLYTGQPARPVAAYHASAAATKCVYHRLHPLKALNAALKTIRRYAASLNFEPFQNSKFELEAVYDASMVTEKSQANVCERFFIFRGSESSVHGISWILRCAGIVAKSTRTTDLLAAEDAVNELTYFKFIGKGVFSRPATELIVDPEQFSVFVPKQRKRKK